MLESLLGSHRLPIVKTNDALDICIFESFLLTLHFAFLFLYSVFKVPSSIPPRFLSGGLKNDEVILPWGAVPPGGGLKWTRTTDLTLIRRAL